MERLGLPCDDRKIRQHHEDYLLEALTFFESYTEDIEVTARWIYIEELAVGLYAISTLYMLPLPHQCTLVKSSRQLFFFQQITYLG